MVAQHQGAFLPAKFCEQLNCTIVMLQYFHSATFSEMRGSVELLFLGMYEENSVHSFVETSQYCLIHRTRTFWHTLTLATHCSSPLHQPRLIVIFGVQAA